MTPTPPLAFMSFGFGELLIIGTVALLVFGGQLPDVMRNLGRAYARLREGLNEVAKPVRDELRDTKLPDPRRAIRSAVAEANKPLDQPTDELPDEPDPESEYELSDDEGGEPQPWPTSTPSETAAPKSGAQAASESSPPPRFEEDDDEPLPP